MLKGEWWLRAKVNLDDYTVNGEDEKTENDEKENDEKIEIHDEEENLKALCLQDMAMISQDALLNYEDPEIIQSLQDGWIHITI